MSRNQNVCDCFIMMFTISLIPFVSYKLKLILTAWIDTVHMFLARLCLKWCFMCHPIWKHALSWCQSPAMLLWYFGDCQRRWGAWTGVIRGHGCGHGIVRGFWLYYGGRILIYYGGLSMWGIRINDREATLWGRSLINL